MPKIREYNQQVGAAGPVQFQQLRGSDISAAGGLSSIGRGLSDVADYVEEREVFEARKDMVREQLETRKEISEMERTAPPGAEGFDEQVNSALEKRREKLQEKYSSGKASRFVSQTLDDFQSSVKFGAYEFKARSQGMKDVTDYKDLQAEQQNLLRANPALLKESLKAQADLVAGMRIDESKKFELLKETTAQLYDSSLDGRVSKLATSDKTTIGDVDSMIAQMKNKDGEWVKNNSKPAYDAQLSRLEQLKEHLKQKNQTDYSVLFDQAMNQKGDTGVYFGEDVGKFTHEDIDRNITSPSVRAAMHMKRDMAVAQGEANTFIKSKGLDSAIEEFKKIEPARPGTPDYNAVNMKYETLQKRIAETKKMMEEDPAGTILKFSPVAETAYKYYSENKSPENFAKYAETVKLEQERFYKEGPRGILPKEMKDQTKAIMDKAITGGDYGQKAVEHLQSLQALTGKYYTQSLSEMVKSKALTEEQSIAGFFAQDPKNATLATSILQAQTKSKEEIETLAGPGGLKSVREKLSSKLGPLRSVLSNSLGDVPASNVMNTYMEAFAKTAVATGHKSSPEKEAQKLAETVLGTMTIKGSYYIPNTQKEPEYISEGIESFRRAISPSTLNPRSLNKSPLMGNDEMGKAAAERIRQYGKPVTLADNSGLEFLDENGGRVYITKDGEQTPAIFTWDELRAMGAKATLERKKNPASRASSNPFRLD
jgi:hypothetical protein